MADQQLAKARHGCATLQLEAMLDARCQARTYTANDSRVTARLETIKKLLPATIGLLESDQPLVHKMNGVGQFHPLETTPDYLEGVSQTAGSVFAGLAEEPSISIVGLGHSGTVSLACLANRGFRMVGVDIDDHKTMAVAQGQSPIAEDQLEELLGKGVREGLISTTTNLIQAVNDTVVTFISVDTPTAASGSCDLTGIRAASKAIGTALADKQSFHVVVVRSSVPPGTTLDVVARQISETSGKILDRDFGVCFNPEFLREGTAVADFYDPPRTIVGHSDQTSRDIVQMVLGTIDDDIIFTSPEVAELAKHADNVWQATKAMFANEIDQMCSSFDIDSHDVMDILSL